MAAILKIDIRYDVITPALIVWLLWNLAGGCKMICLWLYTRQNRNRKQNCNIAAVLFR